MAPRGSQSTSSPVPSRSCTPNAPASHLLDHDGEVHRLRRMVDNLEGQIEELKDGKKRKRGQVFRLARFHVPKLTSSRIETETLGRGLYKLVDLYHPVKTLIHFADTWDVAVATNGEPNIDAMDDDDEREKWMQLKRGRAALTILPSLIPNFDQEIQRLNSRRLNEWSDKLQQGSANARGDDIGRLKVSVAGWLNNELGASPVIRQDDRHGRGLQHPLCGRLMCPAEFNWDDPEVAAKIIACDSKYPLGPTANVLLPAERPSVEGKSFSPPQQTWKHIFTSPSSANDVDVGPESNQDENTPPLARQRIPGGSRASAKKPTKSVAANVNLTRVTPRSIAYAAVQLLFALSSAPGYCECYQGLNFREVYYYIVDFFDVTEGSPSLPFISELLGWWDSQVFPTSVATPSSGTSKSKQKLRELREKRAAAALAGVN
ncbi:hypothetical protein BKA70DRAFT_1521303 [Coprinopsis sp. MPI-PUGE-AT-0042]|nr:hypothetical protein BKA70DRAFT_1521303 [Coprinopsis sp. MPI-PUGE-AT-0042]